jgi:integrase
MPAFMARLAGQDGMGARALTFAILTAARSGEVRGARWSEIDLERATWTLPPDRMKGAREHRVPLAESALAILAPLAKLRDGSGLVFHGQRHGTPMSDMTLTAVLRRMGRGDLTAHGFRSTFRDWAAETTAHPNHVVELALAHAIGNAVEAAYRRGDLLEKRTVLMADWASYLAKPEADVVALRAA